MADNEIKKPEEFKEADPNEGFVDIEQLAKNKDIKGLINVLQNAQKKYLVKEALFALYGVGDKTAIPSLLDYALYGKWGMASREAAIRALAHIGKHEVVEPLIYIMLIGKGNSTFGVAAKALGEIKDERALKPLTFVMTDTNQESNYDREEALKALGSMATNESIAAIIGVLDSDLAEIASSVLKEVGQAAVEPLVSALSNANQTIREKASAILGEMVLDMKATESLISIMKSDILDTGVIKSVVTVLGQLGDKSATKPLLAAFKKYLPTDSGLTEDIIKALGKIKDSSAVQPLLTALKAHYSDIDDDYNVQRILVRALGHIGDKKATIRMLRLLLDKSNDSHLRVEAAWALGIICDDEAIEPLVTVLRDNRDNNTVRHQVFNSLLKYSGDTATSHLLAFLKAHHDLLLLPAPLPFSGDDWLTSVW